MDLQLFEAACAEHQFVEHQRRPAISHDRFGPRDRAQRFRDIVTHPARPACTPARNGYRRDLRGEAIVRGAAGAPDESAPFRRRAAMEPKGQERKVFPFQRAPRRRQPSSFGNIYRASLRVALSRRPLPKRVPCRPLILSRSAWAAGAFAWASGRNLGLPAVLRRTSLQK